MKQSSSASSALHGSAAGKAAALVRLLQAGFSVPEFDYVSPDVEAQTAAIDAVRRLGFPIAVRASAHLEDDAEHEPPCAGQFRYFLNLESIAEVVHAIRQCRASTSEPSVIDECHRHHLDPKGLKMGVLIQRMIRPELAGLAHTVHPLTGDHAVVIKAVDGPAGDLVGGRRKPLPEGHPLLARYEARIRRVARQAHRHFGTPQDIEFAVADDVVFLIQSRPVARIYFPSEIGEWTTAEFGDGGLSSGVCTPLMWSLVESPWQEALPGLLRDLGLLRGDFIAAHMFFGRPYWNLGAVKYRLAFLPGFDEIHFEDELGVHRPADGDQDPGRNARRGTPVSLAGILRAARVALAARSVWKRQFELNGRLLNGGFESMIRPFQVAIGDPDRFRELIDTVYHVVETNHIRTIFCVLFARMDFLESFPDSDVNALTAALPEMNHMAPARMIREMAVCGERDLAPLLRRFGYQSRQERELRAPRWNEDHAWVRLLLEGSAAPTGKDPRPAYEQAREKARSTLARHRRRRFDRKLDRLRQLLWMREQMRDLSSRTRHLIRRYVLRIAERGRLNDDIFFMTWRQLLLNDRSQVAVNREIQECYRHFEAPREVGAGRELSVPIHRGAELRGIGASPGRIGGCAWTAASIEEALEAPAGSVLVCPYIDPGWIPVLNRFSAVISESGGRFSHTALICRELGIAAVLNVPGAVRRIHSGATVVVDGGDGTIRVDEFDGALADDRREVPNK